MRIGRDNLWLCSDCTQGACNGLSDTDIAPTSVLFARITSGLERLGPHLVSDFDSETGKGLLNFSAVPCACCKTTDAGYRARFAILK